MEDLDQAYGYILYRTTLTDPISGDLVLDQLHDYARIYVDGKFVGSTPSTLALPPGSHQIRIEVDKFKPWTRTLESNAGSTVSVRATLVKK